MKYGISSTYFVVTNILSTTDYIYGYRSLIAVLPGSNIVAKS